MAPRQLLAETNRQVTGLDDRGPGAITTGCPACDALALPPAQRAKAHVFCHPSGSLVLREREAFAERVRAARVQGLVLGEGV